MQPMDQEVTVSMKQHYQTDLLKIIANEDDNIISKMEENDSIGCYIQCFSGMVFCESSNAGSILKENFSSFRRNEE
jgi:hypothetical protein